MSDNIKHECGIALVRLKKDLNFYADKYGTPFYGLSKMYLLMEKQHNRGQDGAGIASVKLNVEPGNEFINRLRSKSNDSITDVFKKANNLIDKTMSKESIKIKDIAMLKQKVPFAAQIFLGHVRYGTYGGNTIEAVHPFIRENISKGRNLVVAGNFNMTNVDELFDRLVSMGHHPVKKVDTITVMERIGHFLDEEYNLLYDKLKSEGVQRSEIPSVINKNFDISNVLIRAAKRFDGGFVMAGISGLGDAFVLRDPSAIRPAYYFENDEVVVVASERPCIQTAFSVEKDDVKEIPRGDALIIYQSGKTEIKNIIPKLDKKACSFERIYFSRGNDADIYQERKDLGKKLAPIVLEKISYDIKNSVFSYIPSTAETAFFGLREGIEDFLNEEKNRRINELLTKGELSEDKLTDILSLKARCEKIAVKDTKLRTFISQDSGREDLVSHIYDVTYGVVKKTDSLIIIDDSIVRGTTLNQSIIKNMDRLGPKQIIIVSSSPQIRYPDCYGIDMARLGDFIAFRAVVELLKENSEEYILEDIYLKCKKQQESENIIYKNYIKEIYSKFSENKISDKIAQLITPEGTKAKVKVIFQSVENLKQACPYNSGDWYFTGDYPTLGGNRVVNNAFINFMEGNNNRAY